MKAEINIAVLLCTMAAACTAKSSRDAVDSFDSGPFDLDQDGYDHFDDCDDLDRSVFPGAPEYCDLVDNDCDGAVDEGLDGLWYRDDDGDGYGDDASTAAGCLAPEGYAGRGGDCADDDASTNPGAAEVCDGQDQDCDSIIDEEAQDGTLWFADSDGDGVGDPSSPRLNCERPEGYVEDDSDCDDAQATVYPGAVDDCDLLDNDCDGLTDEGIADTFCEDFEAHELGFWPSDWVLETPWQGDPAPIIEVREGAAANGERALYSTDVDQGGPTFVPRGYKNYDERLFPTYIQASMRWDSQDYRGFARLFFSDTTGDDDDQIEPSDSSGEPWGAADVLSERKLFEIKMTHEQELTITGYDGIIDVTAELWYRVEWRNIDWEAGSVEVWVNGELLEEEGSFETSELGIDSLMFRNDDQEVWVDRVQMRE